MAISKVIKSDGSSEVAADRPALRPGRAGVVNAEVYDAHQKAAELIEAAQQRAAEIREAAQQERLKLLEETREQGRQEGLASVTEILLNARSEREALLASTEQAAVALACKIAEKIIGRDLERSPEVVVDICATAIENVRSVSALTVRVNPRDAAILRERKKHLMELIGRVKDIAIKEDSDVPQAGCIIETESGTIDAQLSTQLEMIQRVLLSEPTAFASEKE